jgi:hypothetical protein
MSETRIAAIFRVSLMARLRGLAGYHETVKAAHLLVEPVETRESRLEPPGRNPALRRFLARGA